MELSHETLCNIVDLQKLAMSMTMEKFINTIKSDVNCVVRNNHPFIDFDWRNLTATICLNARTLSGSIDVWDKEGSWCDTMFFQSVSFAKEDKEEEEKEYRLVSIKWDVSDSEFETFVNENVPREVYVPMCINEHEIADWLSDEYGYCVESLTIKE